MIIINSLTIISIIIDLLICSRLARAIVDCCLAEATFHLQSTFLFQWTDIDAPKLRSSHLPVITVFGPISPDRLLDLYTAHRMIALTRWRESNYRCYCAFQSELKYAVYAFDGAHRIKSVGVSTGSRQFGIVCSLNRKWLAISCNELLIIDIKGNWTGPPPLVDYSGG